MSLTEILRKDMFEARKASEAVKADILGMALASLKNAQIASDKELTEEQEIAVLRKEAKKLKDAVEQYTSSGNTALAEKESAQLEVISAYLPKMMSEEDIEKVIADKIEELSVMGLEEMGHVMGIMMGELKGKADGSVVKKIVEKLLTK